MDHPDKQIYINITWRGILKIIIILALVYFLYLTRGILAILFVAFLISSAIEPAVDWLQKRKIPRALSSVFLYLAVISVIGVLVYFFVPPITREVVEFSKNFPEYVSRLTSRMPFLDGYSDNQSNTDLINEINSLGANWQGAAGKIFHSLVSFFGGIFSFILIIVISLYMIAEDGALNKLIVSIVPKKNQAHALSLSDRIQNGVGRWLRGQLLLSLVIFVIIYVTLLIIGVKYALILAFIAAIAEFIPYLGPLIAAIPALIVALIQSPVLIIAILILYYLTHWLESNVLVPQIMRRFIGLNPIVIIAVMLAGFELAGIIGTVLAIPLAMAANIILGDIIESRDKKD
jgi:predicted PurR-regulated permease PerM